MPRLVIKSCMEFSGVPKPPVALARSDTVGTFVRVTSGACRFWLIPRCTSTRVVPISAASLTVATEKMGGEKLIESGTMKLAERQSKINGSSVSCPSSVSSKVVFWPSVEILRYTTGKPTEVDFKEKLTSTLALLDHFYGTSLQSKVSCETCP